MGRIALLVVGLAVLCFVAAPAWACDSCGCEGHVKGTVVKVEDGKITAKLGDKEKTFTTDDKTAVTVDGKEAKLADVKEGMTVKITPEGDLAKKIEATSAEKKGD